MKKLLGLESFPLTEEEIMQRIKEAHRKNLEEVVFSTTDKQVKVKLQKVSRAGLMRQYTDWDK